MAQTPPPETPSSPEPQRGGINIQGGDVRAGRDIVGGDVNIGGDSISGETVTIQRGYSAMEVQRLVLIVGGLVFATALVFFIVGAVAAAPLVAALSRPVGSRIEEARRMEQKIAALNALPAGQAFRVTFSEDEVSSYFRFLRGPENNISDGKARFTGVPGEIVLGGNLDNLGGLPMMAVIQTTTAQVPFELKSVWIKLLPTPPGIPFGWIDVTPFAGNLRNQINSLLFWNVQFVDMAVTPTQEGVIGGNLVLLGVAR